jgi:molybdopterin-synthase adenylyltransferase
VDTPPPPSGTPPASPRERDSLFSLTRSVGEYGETGRGCLPKFETMKMSMPLSDTEIERYARHIVLPEVGGPGQNRLKQSSVLVIGAGGLGAPLLLYLAAAGVGRIGIVDHDTVSLSNLQRQVIHTTESIGLLKTESAAQQIAAINPHVVVEQHPTRITTANALDLMARYDVVADGCDNFPTRFLVSDACYFARKPLVSAAVGQFDGQIATFRPYEKGQPTYRCFIGDLPERGLFPACEEAGVMGALPGIIGAMQAMEVLKEILGIGESLVGRILMYDALAARFFETALKWSPDNPLTGVWPRILDLRPENYDDGPAACAARST